MRRQARWMMLIVGMLVASWVLAACGDEKKVESNCVSESATANRTPVRDASGQITVVAPPANSACFGGTIYYVKNYNIYKSNRDLTNGQALATDKLNGTKLTDSQPNALVVVNYPSLSPDGKRLAYSFSPEPVKNASGNLIIGADIMSFDLSSNQASVLVARPEPDAYLEWPIWSPDGKYIYYQYRGLVKANGAITGTRYAIERMEVTSGKRETIVADGSQAAPTPDGKALVFIKVGADDGSYLKSMRLIDLASKQVTVLTKPENFGDIYFPRVSPDGQTIAFSANGGPSTQYDPLNPPTPAPPAEENSRALKVGFGLNNSKFKTQNSTLAHGLPWEIFTIKLDGSGVTKQTNLFEDQPMLSWTADSKQLIFLAGQGLYKLDLTTKALQKYSNQGSHDGFDWRP